MMVWHCIARKRGVAPANAGTQYAAAYSSDDALVFTGCPLSRA
jgi:hypothetical protein